MSKLDFSIKNDRKAGILMPIFSLPSNYGIGSLGKAAYEFVDFLSDAGQSYWQILPIGPITYGDSPYQVLSSFAGNPYFIDLDLLVEEKLLSKKDLIKYDKEYIDYEFLYKTRNDILYKAYINSDNKYLNEINKFINDNYYIYEYCLFVSIKECFDNKPWLDWTEDIKTRKVETIEEYKIKLENRISFHEFVQYLFFKQFNKLKEYANSKNIKLIGDVPIYVPLDSCDCWLNPECFELDEGYNPTLVAGVPPDYFSKTGQLWGNPIYKWDNMKANGYKWWIDRIGAATKIYDVIRIDHFRGFASYWAVKYGENTAKNGKWFNGPNMDLLNVLKNWFNETEFIAEDLGCFGDDVVKMLDEFGFPGMKVLEFAFDGKNVTNHAPHAHNKNCVCYTGTHDNSTTLGWLTASKKADVQLAKKYMNLADLNDFNWHMISLGMSSVANTFICQMQDYLGLDDSSRINTPGTIGNNWKWKMDNKSLNKKLAKKIKEYTKMYERCE